MDFKHFDWSFKSILKVIGLAALGLIVLGIAFALIAFAFRTVFDGGSNYRYQTGYDYDDEIMGGFATSESSSIRSLNQKIVIEPEPDQPATGDTAEDFEIRTHNGTINTRKLEETCTEIAELKTLDYVIFENANQSKKSCYYSFKVKLEHEEEILAKIKDLNPESFNTQIYTIKKIIDDYDSELEILQKQLEEIEATLSQAQNAYDELQVLATEKEDIESLTKIIDSKLNLIEKLTQQRIEVRTEIDEFNKSKAEQLDRLEYVYFNLNVYEDLYIDIEEIKNSWKYEIQAFVDNFNELLQDLSINLVAYILNLVKALVYLILSFVMLKVVWLFTKKIWWKK